MSFLKKLIGLLILFAIGYFVGQQLGLIGTTSSMVQAIDARFGIDEAKLVPGDSEELERYEKELRSLEAGNSQEEALVELKLELVGMQKAMIEFSDNSSKIDFDDVDCRISGPIIKSRNSLEEALEHAQNAVQKKNSVRGLEGFRYITSSEFDRTMNQVTSSLKKNIDILKTVC